MFGIETVAKNREVVSCSYLVFRTCVLFMESMDSLSRGVISARLFLGLSYPGISFCFSNPLAARSQCADTFPCGFFMLFIALSYPPFELCAPQICFSHESIWISITSALNRNLENTVTCGCFPLGLTEAWEAERCPYRRLSAQPAEVSSIDNSHQTVSMPRLETDLCSQAWLKLTIKS